MVDRLEELKADISDEEDVEMEEKHEEEQDPVMKEYFEDVNSIQNGMAEIRRNLLTIEEKYGQSLVSMDLDQGARASEELEKIITETNLTAQDIRNKLQRLDEVNPKDKKQKNEAQLKIRKNMKGALTKKFVDLMTEYQELQNKYKNKYRERVAAQYKLVKPDASEEEIDTAIESGDTQIFAKAILDMERKEKAKTALSYVQNKSQDIRRLEQSILELHQLFLDLAVMVEAQGELIDQIEDNVSTTLSNTKSAVENLRAANKYQKKSRKRMCCLIVIFIIILVVLLGLGGILGGVFGSKASTANKNVG